MGFVTEHFDVVIAGDGASARALATEDVPEPDNRMTADGHGHLAGTCRFGADSATSVRDENTSVLDENTKAHELDNLYAVHASFFPNLGAVNSALIAMADAIRVGEHLVSRMS